MIRHLVLHLTEHLCQLFLLRRSRRTLTVCKEVLGSRMEHFGISVSVFGLHLI